MDFKLFLHIFQSILLLLLGFLQFRSWQKRPYELSKTDNKLKSLSISKMKKSFLYFSISHLCWNAEPTTCSIRTFTMFAIFNPLTAWDSNLVCMADLEIHSYKIKHVKFLLQSDNNKLTPTLDKQMCLILNGKMYMYIYIKNLW